MVSTASEAVKLQLLSPEDVGTVLSAISEYDPIIVGGQCISMWVDFLAQTDPQLAQLGSVSSADVDYFEHPKAAESLKEKLKGEILWPEDAISLSPNYCTVAAFVGGKKIHIDFMRNVLGVDTQTMMDRCVIVAGSFPNIEGEIRLALMHPIDCVQSRLANIETLKRLGDGSLYQTDASFKIVEGFVRQLVSLGELKQAQKTLMNFELVMHKRFYQPGVYPHLRDRIDPPSLLRQFLTETAFDSRWREKILSNAANRLDTSAAKARARLNT